jgi:hypothetical protein
MASSSTFLTNICAHGSITHEGGGEGL